jgi:periplasmic protein TonB
MNAFRVSRRGAYVARGTPMSWSLASPGTGHPVVERQRFSPNRPATSAAAPIALSTLAHAAALLAFTLLLPSRIELPDVPDATRVAMVFESAPPLSASADIATPPDVHDSVPAPSAPIPTAAPTPIPPPVPRPPSPIASAPTTPPTLVPAPAPATPPIPVPAQAAERVPELAPPPPSPPPPKQQTASREHTPPERPRASPRPRTVRTVPRTATPSPAPTEAPPTDLAAVRPAAAASLVPPRPVSGMATNRAPAYPEISLRRHEQGRVVLRVSVSAHGLPLEVDVLQTSGHPQLDDAAQTAVRHWEFIPAMQDGRPVRAVAEVPIRFRLGD